ncbi:hypothetical protein IL38_23840 [Actinopolyspora erythraea]|uniref:2'-5' RNA ligase family protein n=1 Tax=Actinopolyspora erythraea TaxID=414996 RepID=A0ABR4WY85_9ACTN|nr:hypothetical protein IL38_23840 [Actinopolyspora erythraea]
MYALPSPEVRETARQYHEAVADAAAEHGLGLQPLDYLHATVQMLRVATSEIGQPELDNLTSALRAGVAKQPPLVLQVGPPQVTRSAMEMWVSPETDESWRGLVETVRGAVQTSLGDDALPPLGSNAVPHLSLGYGYGDGDSGALASALRDVRAPLARMPVTSLSLLAVTQHPEAGQLSWTPVATLPLANTSDDAHERGSL